MAAFPKEGGWLWGDRASQGAHRGLPTASSVEPRAAWSLAGAQPLGDQKHASQHAQ